MDKVAFTIWERNNARSNGIALSGGVAVVSYREYVATNNALELAYNVGARHAVEMLTQKRKRIMAGLSLQAFIATQARAVTGNAKTHSAK